MTSRSGTLAELYRSIASYWRGGLSPQWIGATLQARARDDVSRAVSAGLAEGKPLSESLARAAGALPPLHVRIVEAAERSGRVPEALDELAAEEQSGAALRRHVLEHAAYPVLVFHMAAFAPLLGAAITSGLGVFVGPALVLVAVDAALVALYRVLFQRVASPALDRVALATPMLGEALETGEARRYVATTNALYEAGIGLPDAFRAAASGVGRPSIALRLADALERLPPEDEPFAHLAVAFPREAPLAGALRVAFQTGDLSATIRQFERPMAESEQATLRRFVRVVSGTLFAAAALLVAFVAVRFYAGLYAGLK